MQKINNIFRLGAFLFFAAFALFPLENASAALAGSPSLASVPIFNYGGSSDPAATHVKYSTCGANQVLVGTRSYQAAKDVDDEYEQAYCDTIAAGATLGGAYWRSPGNAMTRLDPGSKTVNCDAGGVGTGVMMFGQFNSVDDEHIDIQCAPLNGATLSGTHPVDAGNALTRLTGGFKTQVCPAGEAVVGLSWYEWASEIDDEHTTVFCARINFAPTADITSRKFLGMESGNLWDKMLSWFTHWTETAEANHGNSTINQGETVTITWSSTDATTCTVTGPSVSLNSTGGTQNVSGLPAGTHTYTIDCVNNANVHATHSTTVTVLPVGVVNEPIGGVESHSCQLGTVTGWSCDKDTPNSPIDVHVYEGGTLLGSVRADIGREAAIGAACGGGSAHGFSYPIPAALMNASSHTLTFYGLNVGPTGTTNPVIGTRTFNCIPAAINGDCGPAAKAYAATDLGFSGQLCNAGSPSPASPAFPAVGDFTNWTCTGSGGGSNSGTCSASRAAACDNSCAASTCSSTTCRNSCGVDIPGTLSCPDGRCGTANGQFRLVAPLGGADTCSVGAASPWPASYNPVSKSWSWACVNAASIVGEWCSTTGGTLTAANCIIPAGSNTCQANVAWNMTGPNPALYQDVALISNAANGNQPRTLQYGPNTFALFTGATLFHSRTVNAVCAVGTAWQGGSCQPTTDPTITVLPMSCEIPLNGTGCSVNVAWANATAANSIKHSYVNPGPGVAYNTPPVTGTSISAVVTGNVARTMRYGSNIIWNDTGSGPNPAYVVTATCAPGSAWDGVRCSAGIPRSIVVSPSTVDEAGAYSVTVQSNGGASCMIMNARDGEWNAGNFSAGSWEYLGGWNGGTVGCFNLDATHKWTSNVTAGAEPGNRPLIVGDNGYATQCYANPNCTGAFSTVSMAALRINPTPPPTVIFSVNGVNAGGTFSGTRGDDLNVAWTVTGADSCTASVTNGAAAWAGAKDANSGTETVSAIQSGSLRLTCAKGSATTTRSVNINLTCTPSSSLTACGPPCAGGSGTQARTQTFANCSTTYTPDIPCDASVCRDLNWKEVAQ